MRKRYFSFFFFNDTATTEIYTLSLHDALPICHPGGIATIHAGSALGALLRLEQLILEVAVNPPRALIAEAGNVGVPIARRGRKRRIESIARGGGLYGVGYRLAGWGGGPPGTPV